MDERKLKILAAVVDEYIRTGEPVGSKTISKLPDINVSPATVRNDMAMLEQLGYLQQPHTSAGRIPTFNGYRIYIDKLMKPETLPAEEQKRLDEMIDGNSAPKFSVISKVEVIPTGKRLYVILLITSNGEIKNKACRLEFDLSHEQLDFFASFIQENLQGVAVEELSEEMMNKLITAMGTYMMTLTPFVQGIYEMGQDMMKKELMVSGEKNLLSCDDFNKNDLVSFMERKNDFARLLDDSFSGIQVMFSGESENAVISNSSMIVAKYRKDGKTAGSLGIIGPMRLDYARIIPYIEYFTRKISDAISDDDVEDTPKSPERKTGEQK